MNLRRAALTLLAVTAAGCSSAETTDPAPTTPVPVTAAPAEVTTTQAPTTTAAPTTTEAPTTTAAPTTTIDPVIEAQTAYFAISSDFNARYEALSAQYPSITTSNVREVCAAEAALEEGWVAALKTVTWPADVQDEIDNQITASAVAAGALYECANATSGSAGRDIRNAAATNAIRDAASATRVALGLPIERG